MNICFIMNPWESIEYEMDSSLRLIHESVTRGHTVGIAYPDSLTIRDSVTNTFCRIIIKNTKYSQNPMAFYKQVKFKKQMLPLSGFDVIFMRVNPPLDNVILNFLDSVKNDTYIINSVEGLREANNKLYTAVFDDPDQTLIPATHVSKNKGYLLKAIRESSTDKMILKPLNGFGGSGVIVIEKNAQQNVNSLLDFYIGGSGDGNYVILQEYVTGADQGDVRILILHGEPIGAMRRVPAKHDIRSNVHAGGSVIKHTLTKDEKLLCQRIGPKLISAGLDFVGIDIISGKLIEINVCSPGGITRINKLNRVKLQKRVINFIENVIRNKERALKRKLEFRKTVENA